ncbi:acetyl-CoA carboxylase biotin carboxylase subunit family protein [Streptomyces sp. R21]|uniref:Acetyl-CoA carboxylase biotin carboxylase subunit family protein n=1 Tax=Streptomyces sp. R21 TaxID=3238627 RepID=A0AB39NZL8_9ACTN
MHALLIGSRPREAYSALARLGVPFDVVLEDGEEPGPDAGRARHIHRRPYVSDPQSVLTVPRLFDYAGVYSFTEGGLFAASLVTAAVGLPGPSPAAVLATRNKYLMRCTLASHEVTQLPFGLLERDTPPADAYPLIVKPIAGSGSAGVRRLDDPASFKEVLQEVIEEGVPDGSLMWESCFNGPQYTVEGMHDGADFRAVAVTGKVLSGPPHFVVLEHESPAALEPEIRENLVAYARQCLAALGVRYAATHTEIAFHDGQPQLIETHTRPGGDTVPVIAALTTGWDQYELVLGAGWAERAGQLATQRREVRGQVARTLHLTAEDTTPESLADASWLEDFPEFVRVGHACRFPGPGPADPRWGHILIAGDDRERLADTSRRIRARVRRDRPS